MTSETEVNALVTFRWTWHGRNHQHMAREHGVDSYLTFMASMDIVVIHLGCGLEA